VCGLTDPRGGFWETCDANGNAIEPTNLWRGHPSGSYKVVVTCDSATLVGEFGIALSLR
jgi:hypothetical protein